MPTPTCVTVPSSASSTRAATPTTAKPEAGWCSLTYASPARGGWEGSTFMGSTGTRTAVRADVAQLLDPTDIDQMLGRGQAQLHHRHQAVPPGQDLAVGPELRHQARGLGQRLRNVVLEWLRNHCASPGELNH